MFVTFFHELKSAGLPVTLREYLTLMEAMEAFKSRIGIQSPMAVGPRSAMRSDRPLRCEIRAWR